jgi:DNA polymerase bacteriophage-type
MQIVARMDFETYSEAGYIWDEELQLWKPLQATKPGIKGVGAAVYAEHPSTEVLCVAYDLCNGRGTRIWINAYNKNFYPPVDLFRHIQNGGLVEAHNSLFEYFIWKNVCEKKYNWPPISLAQMRCSASRVRSLSIPGDLKTAAVILKAKHQKMDDGKRLINKFSIPKKPAKKDPRKRIRPEDDPEDAANIYKYCIGDVDAENDISDMTPELLPQELKLWQLDQRINAGGVYIDRPLLYAMIYVVERAVEKYTKELSAITGGVVSSAGKLQKMSAWLESKGLTVDTLQAENVEELLKDKNITGDPRRVLEIRSLLGLASVKKLYAMKNRLCNDGRIRDLFLFFGALHTGRWTGTGVQPQNLTASAENMDEIIADIMRYDIDLLEKKYGSPIDAVSSCIRGLFCAPPGRKLICSDFKAIEAVVLACLAGEKWRIEVFRTHGMIYEMSASKISGVPFQEFVDYPKNHNGEKHPLRKTVGKVAELASGYQGWIGAWKKFGADKFMGDEEIKAAILRWRLESPNIAGDPKRGIRGFWRSMEDYFIMAVKNPGTCYAYRGIGFGVKDSVLQVRLLSGRCLRYHEPRADFYGYDKFTNDPLYKLSFVGQDSKTKQWQRLETYGGCLTENVVQAVSRDFLANALLNLDAAGYTPVLHVHDEPVAEVPENFGTVEEFEKCMTSIPLWAAGWPIKAGGGWQGKRYHK